MTRRASRLDSNHGEIIEALLGVTGVTCHSLAGVGCGVPDLLVGGRFSLRSKTAQSRLASVHSHAIKRSGLVRGAAIQ